MAQATLLATPKLHEERRPASAPVLPPPAFRFESLVLTEKRSLAKGRSATLTVSLVAHAVLIAAIIIVPLLLDDTLPAPGDAVRAFFVTPAAMAPPPPPPPPPAPGVRVAPRTPVAPQPQEEAKFVAPVETPAEIRPEEGLSFGVEGGVPGGVEGGVPGGVVGGIVGGLPSDAPPPPARAVRVGGQIKAPQLVKKVAPVYPELAKTARLSALVVLEATVGTDGRVEAVSLLRGHPLFDQAAMEAVRRWVYRPLLLNGVPTDFIVTVTLSFSVKSSAPAIGGS